MLRLSIQTPNYKQFLKKAGMQPMNRVLVNILNSAYNDDRLTITSDYSSVKDCDAIIVAIPLLIDAQKKILDIPFLDTIKKIAPFAKNKLPIIIETSIPVGFARNKVIPAIESTGKTTRGRFFAGT